MRTYAEPPLTFVRGEGTVRLRRRRQGLSRLHYRPGRGVARTCPSGGGRRRGRAGPHAEPRVQPLRQRSGSRGGTHHRPPGQRRHGAGRRAGLLRQLGGRGQRVRAQAGPALGRRRPPRRDQRRQLVPRAHPGHADRDRASPRSRRPSCRCPRASSHVPYDDVAALDEALDPDTVAAVLLEPLQGEGGVMVPSSDYLGAVRDLCSERNASAHARRGADRAGPHGTLVRLPGPGTPARRRDHGQGARQRHASGRLLGAGRGGRRVRSRRPRLDLRRPAPGPRRGPGHPGHHGGGGRLWTGAAGGGDPDRRVGRAARGGVGAGRRPAAGRPTRRARGQGGDRARPRARAAGQPGATRRGPGGPTPPGARRRAGPRPRAVGSGPGEVGAGSGAPAGE